MNSEHAMLSHQAPLAELHTRPWVETASPLDCYHFALKLSDQASFYQKLALYVKKHGILFDEVPDFYRHIAFNGGSLTLESHAEFTSLTYLYKNEGDGVFFLPEFQLILQEIEAEIIIASHIEVLKSDHERLSKTSASISIENATKIGASIGGSIGNGAALIMSSFERNEAGFYHVRLHDYGMSKGQLGRTIQRIYELLDYASLALRALPEARKATPKLNQYEQDLSHISNKLAKDNDAATASLMNALNRNSAAIEEMVASHSYIFSAAKAYSRLVAARIKDLRETKIEGLQSIQAFMERRFSPAMRTITSVETRQNMLAERARRVGALMRTMIDHVLQEQNTDLLSSVSHRITLQIKLQRMVEGLSVIAISYYLAGLVGYMVTALAEFGLFDFLKAYGISLNGKVATGAAIPFLMFAVWRFLKRQHRKI